MQDGLRDDPALANSDPTGAGWFFKVKLSNPAQLDALMDKTAYDELLKNARFGPRARLTRAPIAPLADAEHHAERPALSRPP